LGPRRIAVNAVALGPVATDFSVVVVHNAAANIYRYPEERENRIGNGPTRVEMGDQEFAPVPVVDTRIFAYHGART
jgi:hypothetical protein